MFISDQCEEEGISYDQLSCGSSLDAYLDEDDEYEIDFDAELVKQDDPIFYTNKDRLMDNQVGE